MVLVVPILGTTTLPDIRLEKKLKIPNIKIPKPNWDSVIFNLSIFQGICTKYIPIININKKATPKHAFHSLLKLFIKYQRL